MLELLGSGYVIDHVIAEWNRRMDEKVFRIYVSDLLKSMAESWGNQINYRYTDLIEPAEEEPENGDEIALAVIERAGLKVE